MFVLPLCSVADSAERYIVSYRCERPERSSLSITIAAEHDDYDGAREIAMCPPSGSMHGGRTAARDASAQSSLRAAYEPAAALAEICARLLTVFVRPFALSLARTHRGRSYARSARGASASRTNAAERLREIRIVSINFAQNTPPPPPRAQVK